MASARVLIAGIGNIFLGDDAFGVEVVRALSARTIPGDVLVKDFGIRSFDLAYALLDPWEAIILIDALPRGEAPGTLYTLEIDSADFAGAAEAPDAHSMNPVKVLQLAQTSGRVTARIYVVGCEPGDCGGEEGRMGLTPAVSAVIETAAEMARELAQRIFAEKTLTAVR